MTLHLKMPSKVNNLSPQISVIGVGGAGGNIINSMIESKIEGVEFLNVNTDSQQLKHSQAEKTLQLGPTCTQGLGAGADPEMGKKAAEEVASEIEEYLENSNMVFLTAGMGGGTGTGATPVVARIAKDLGILTVGVVTKPFDMEGKRRLKQGESGILELQKYVDNLIVIPNQNIFHSAKPDTSFSDALQLTNDVLIDGVKSIIDLMVKPGIMNHDFADVKAIMSETGKVHLGTGIAEGESRSIEATEKAISNPLLEYNSMSGAKGVLINITCGEDTTLHEVDLAINKIKQESDEDANIIWGVQKEKNFENKFKISVISTGIDSENYFKNRPKEEYSNIKDFRTASINDENLQHDINIEQSNFFVDSQPSNKIENSQLNESSDLDVNFENTNNTDKSIKNIQNNKIEKKSEKKSLFSRIFGPKKENKVSHDDKNLMTEDDSKNDFKTEMKEILKEKNNIKDENDLVESQQNKNDGTIEDSEKDVLLKNDSLKQNEGSNLSDFKQKKQNDLDDDLLQIPAFLRRQAN